MCRVGATGQVASTSCLCCSHHVCKVGAAGQAVSMLMLLVQPLVKWRMLASVC